MTHLAQLRETAMNYEACEAENRYEDATLARPRAALAAAHELAKEVAVLDETLSLLRDRLGPLLKPSVPRPESGEKLAAVPSDEFGEHTQELHRIGRHVSSVRRSLGDVMDRLEV